MTVFSLPFFAFYKNTPPYSSRLGEDIFSLCQKTFFFKCVPFLRNSP